MSVRSIGLGLIAVGIEVISVNPMTSVLDRLAKGPKSTGIFTNLFTIQTASECWSIGVMAKGLLSFFQYDSRFETFKIL